MMAGVDDDRVVVIASVDEFVSSWSVVVLGSGPVKS